MEEKNPDESHPLLGIDYGDARVGLAATDTLGIMAHPVATVARDRAIEQIIRIVGERKIVKIVLGLPFNLDGEEGKSAQKVRKFAGQLQKKLPHVPIDYIDESYTTVDAAEKLHRSGRSARRQKSVIDQAAAIEILERWMGKNG